jgi:hypothetical protein
MKVFCNPGCRRSYLTDRQNGLVYGSVKALNGDLKGWLEFHKTQGLCPYCLRRVVKSRRKTTATHNAENAHFCCGEEAPTATPYERDTTWDSPHEDESGPSRPVPIATCLAGKRSGSLVMHMTPAEEKEYNRGMARLAKEFG